MECVVLKQTGPGVSLAEALEVQQHPRPELEEGTVIVEVLAASVNQSCYKNTQGAFPFTTPGVRVGRDFCGRVIEGPQELKGQIVWGTGGKDHGYTGHGVMAQYVKLSVRAVLPKPSSISVAQAGAMGVPFLTAAVAMQKIQIRAGETLVVAGANGQVGRCVLSIAKLQGASTVGIVRRKGPVQFADVVVNSSDGDLIKILHEAVGEVDAVVDCVGIGTDMYVKALGHNGRLVLMAAPAADTSFPLEIRSFYRKNLTLHSVETMQHNAEVSASFLRDLLPGFENGALTPPEIHPTIFTLKGIAEAYQLVGTGCEARVVVAPNGLDKLAAL
ncbi:unnamed protein product [Polarella glacialis]|uniref:Enoyl reductase (ER) domain-containing protein n=1 Tax=Polarella glacialis TaxID=89957 RepID=A0A813K0Q5_POLGL|nr:unnamed protein product [Polarella glacialis]